MQITDTIVFVGAINPDNKHHAVAKRYLEGIADDLETFVPSVTLIEFDLVMKGRKYTRYQRNDAFDWLSSFIPDSKIIPNSVPSLKKAADFEEEGVGYFDSLVSALAMEKEAEVLTTDYAISRVARTKW